MQIKPIQKIGQTIEFSETLLLDYFFESNLIIIQLDKNLLLNFTTKMITDMR